MTISRRALVGGAVAAAASAAETDGTAAGVLVREARVTRDAVRGAVRAVDVVEVNGARVTLGSGNYHLPVAAGGVQIT